MTIHFQVAQGVVELTVDRDVDAFGDGVPDPVLSRARVRPRRRLVQGCDEQRAVGKLVVGDPARQDLVVQNSKI